MHWADYAGIRKHPRLLAEMVRIVRSITQGGGVPEEHYRAGIDRDRDGLLEEKGIMHLHLGGRDSDVLVFLIQYAEQVVLLESNSHVHFRTQPAGKNIVALTQAWFAGLEHGMAEAARQAQEAADEVSRQEAETRRAELAAAIAAFRIKAGLE